MEANCGNGYAPVRGMPAMMMMIIIRQDCLLLAPEPPQQPSCLTLSRVSTEMGDRSLSQTDLELITKHIGTNRQSSYSTKPPGPTQPDHPSVGRQNEYWRWLRPPLGKKRRVLCNSRPCYQDCWHTGPVSNAYWLLQKVQKGTGCWAVC